MPKPQGKPRLIIFSSRALLDIAEAIRANLEYQFEVTPWSEGFFRSNELALNTFLKKLLCYDAAVVVLGADDLRKGEKDGRKQVWVPRDNVIFELGACMSRLGTQKTFLVCPKEPPVVLPTYFKGFYPLSYDRHSDGNLQSTLGGARTSIKNQFTKLDRNAYYSDLPAQGLAFGYFFNFVSPVYKRFRGCKKMKVDVSWSADAGFRLHIVMPDEFLGRDKVDQVFDKKKLVKMNLDLADGRNICVYRQTRKKATERLDLFDIPTTLLTSRRVIDKVDAFWGGGDLDFKQSLESREITNFRRAISDVIASSDDISPDCVKVIDMDEFNQLA